MKRKEKQLANLKYQLRTRKNRGEKKVVWRLSSDQKNFVEDLGYRTEPFLYSVHTRKFPYAIQNNRPSIIKKVHNGASSGKDFIICKLKKDEKDLLKEYGIKFYVERYIIFLV